MEIHIYLWRWIDCFPYVVTMEPITELEDSLDTLLKVMASAIAYLSRKAGHKQVNQEVPLTTLGNTEGLSEDVLASNREELIEDLISQAKDVEQRISDLSLASVKEDAQVRLTNGLHVDGRNRFPRKRVTRS